MVIFMPASSLDTVTQNVYEEMSLDHAAVDPAVHPQGRGDRQVAGGTGPVRGDARLDAPRPRRPRHRERVRVRAVRRDGRVEPRDVLGDRQRRHPRDAQARLFAGLRGRHHRGGRHARHPAAAVDHDDPVRGRRRAVARAALPRRHRPGRAAGRCCSRHTPCSAIGASTRRRWSPSTRPARRPRCSPTSTSRCARSSRCCRASCRSSCC